MSAPNSNILALFHDGHYLAEIVGGGIRVGKQQGASADFQSGMPESRRLVRLHEVGSMDQIHAEVQAQLAKHSAAARGADLKDGDKDWDSGCQVCGQKPTVHPTQLCGPCCFGEAETAGGNW
ncbi:hypothetical protein [Achromobacter piechaudii]|uniref:hypothetical protein n=1 Tax=Achromobacter piechaudii TaxID=72556 RepID=UPI00146951E0|nr:hypothetical protein [Achromobacter piechaudii]CAB3952798.1 hypothetical protein LMG6103_03565 [Achromobacter piechaudii]